MRTRKVRSDVKIRRWGGEGVRKETHKLKLQKPKEAFWPSARKTKTKV